MEKEHRPQHEREHEGMSQDEARHEEDIKHHPYGKEAEEEEK